MLVYQDHPLFSPVAVDAVPSRRSGGPGHPGQESGKAEGPVRDADHGFGKSRRHVVTVILLDR